MRWWDDSDVPFERDVPLASMTWYRLGGPARRMAHPSRVQDLHRILERARDNDVPVKLLGGGANVLVRDDGFDGLVVRLDDETFSRLRIEGDRVHAGAGVNLTRLVRLCSRLGLAGLEGLAGIPGTVGGAIRMNAGGRWGQISDAVVSVEVVRPESGPQRLSREDIGFGYRSTSLDDALVTSALFQLRQQDPEDVYRRFREVWKVKTDAQPLDEHSAGCVFKNPGSGSAGQLIDRAGMKGQSCGGAVVSQRHANFIVARKGSTAGDVLRLIDRIREQVRDRFGTELELEIDIW